MHIIRNSLVFDKEPPGKEDGRVSLDRYAEDGWLVIEKKKAEKEIELLRSQMEEKKKEKPELLNEAKVLASSDKWMDDEEDFRGYTRNPNSLLPADDEEEKKEEDALDKVSNFFSKVKTKYQETDFKSKAKSAGDSIVNKVTEVKESRRTKNFVDSTKRGFFRFVTQVK